MRLDKFLKNSGIVKRRTVANQLAAGGKISVNGRIAKPSTDIRTGDILEIDTASMYTKIRVEKIPERAEKAGRSNSFTTLEEKRIVTDM